MANDLIPGNSVYDQDKGFNPLAKTMSRDRRILTRLLNHKHMVETIERFEWKNLPPSLPSDIIERVLYFRFKGAMFYLANRFHFLPFTLKGDIDSYGRYIEITPVLFTGQWKSSGDGQFSEDIAFMAGKSYNVVYDAPGDASEGEDSGGGENAAKTAPNAPEDKAVILTDSSLEVSQDYTPMEYMIRPIVEQLVDILVLVNMDLITSAKVFYIVAKDADQKAAIEKEFQDLDRRILNGKRVVVVTAALELKELVGSNLKDSARYFQSYQSIDNLRKDLIGMESGGTFLKQEHMTESETATNSNGGSAILNNALRMRKDFCKIVNKVFGLSIDVEIKGAQNSVIVSAPGAQSKEKEGDDEQ